MHDLQFAQRRSAAKLLTRDGGRGSAAGGQLRQAAGAAAPPVEGAASTQPWPLVRLTADPHTTSRRRLATLARHLLWLTRHTPRQNGLTE